MDPGIIQTQGSSVYLLSGEVLHFSYFKTEQ